MTVIDPPRAPRARKRRPAFRSDDGGPVFREPWEAQAFAMAARAQ